MNSRSCKILVVDDESELVESLSEGLQAQGYQVITATDGVMAVNAARSEKPNLILLDLMLPQLDGFRILKLLKTDERYRDIPILVITARATAEDRTLATECGADGWLTKPVRMEELLEKVRAYEN
ncbi:MAG: response regulator [Candidatus Omnitrophota bacterium]|nr:response regulator [Candidatus Omnitrophota bacterium]